MDARDHSAAIAAAEALLTLDPLAEEVHRALMVIHHRDGRQALALRQYHRCRAILERELGVAPSPETEALRRDLSAGAAPNADGRPHEDRSSVLELRRAIAETQQSLAKVATQLDTLLQR